MRDKGLCFRLNPRAINIRALKTPRKRLLRRLKLRSALCTVLSSVCSHMMFHFCFQEIGRQSTSLLGSLHLLGNLSSLQDEIAGGLADLRETGDYMGFVRHVRGGLAESYSKVRFLKSYGNRWEHLGIVVSPATWREESCLRGL